MSLLSALGEANEAAQAEAAVLATAESPRKDQFSNKHDGSFFEIDGFITDQVFDELLRWAGDRKASDIRIQTDMPVIIDSGGEKVRVTRRPIGQAEIETIVRYVYGEHGGGMLIKGDDLDPSHEVRMGREGIRRYRVNFTSIRIPGGRGVSITIRTLPTTPPKLATLNIEKAIVDNIRPHQGMILVTGPTGSGKSTLLASIIREIAERPDAHATILEYSTPIEYVYDGLHLPSSVIAQTEVGRHLRNNDDDSLGAQYAHAVRNSLRRKPEIILIGEARDRATIEASVEAALTGHLLYSTMHVQGVAETLRRVVQPFPIEAREAMAVDIMQSLRMVVTQLLWPRRGGGRVACREYMVFDNQTRAKFLNRPVGEWPSFARKLMAERRVPCQTMAQGAWILFKNKELTADVYKSIVASERDSA